MKLLIFSGLLLLLGILSEGASVYWLLAGSNVLFCLFHLLSSICAGGAIVLYLTHFYKAAPWSIVLLGVIFSCAIPVFGIFITFYLYTLLSRSKFRSKFEVHVELLNNLINLELISTFKPTSGEGGAYRKLLDQELKADKRSIALFRLGQGNLSDVNHLLYELLSDSSDEIRLLSFNILDQQESQLTKDIKELTSILATKKLDPIMYAKFEKNLAMVYWELSYKHLVLHEMEGLTLKKAQSYALSAINIVNNDATLWALLGKILVHLNEFDKAEEAFTKTKEFNIPPSQVMPYLAEIKFLERDYGAITSCLESDTFLDIPKLALVKHFWDMT